MGKTGREGGGERDNLQRLPRFSERERERETKRGNCETLNFDNILVRSIAGH